PNHKDINKLGIMPDNVVPLEQPLTYFDVATEMDNQYEVAVELLTSDSVVANAK
ncbi:MAG: carboxyl-terminal protease, partial [Cyanobacteria bacterium J083]